MLPPLVPGPPLIGSMSAFRRDPVAFMRTAYEKYGPVFMFRLGPKRVVGLIGRQYHRLFFRETDRSLTTPEIYRFLTPMFGEVLGACPFAEYRDHRRAILPFFSEDFAARHLDIMVRETHSVIAELGEHGEFALWDVFEHLALTIALNAVLGPELCRSSSADFGALFRDIARGMDYILPPNLPLPRFLRRNRARRKLHAVIAPLIERRRSGVDTGEDLFQHLAVATGTDGSLLPLDKVAGLTLIMVHGAYETVAAQACWCFLDLITRPDLLRAVRAERQMAWHGTSAIEKATLSRQRLLRSAVLESMRLRPAATVVCRYAVSALDVAPYTIPAGALVMVCPGVAHRLAEVFPNPANYVPNRFVDTAIDALSFMTFGGGLHRCLGSDFAIDEIMIALSLLLARFECCLKTPPPEPDYSMSVTRPAFPCTIGYFKRSAEREPQTPRRLAAIQAGQLAS